MPLSPAKQVKHDRTSILDGIAPTLSQLLNTKKESLFTKESRTVTFDDVSQTRDVVEENDEPTVISVMCGRIKFAGIVVPPDAPKDLICEECEKAFSVYYCNACQQLQCESCADMVHPKDYGGALLHAHEVNDRIRPVQKGDVSKIKPDTSFVMPDTELFEDDYCRMKDLSRPHSLSTNAVATPQPSTVICRQAPKYDANQIVLFIDPYKGSDAYGRIISQWDHRHSSAAPAILRGDASNVYYIVQMLGAVPHMGLIHRLEELCHPERVKPTDSALYVNIEGVERDGERQIMAGAREVNRRVQELRNIQLLGPKHHLRQIGKGGIAGADDDDDDGYSSALHSQNSSQLVIHSRDGDHNSVISDTQSNTGIKQGQHQQEKQNAVMVRSKSLTHHIGGGGGTRAVQALAEQTQRLNTDNAALYGHSGMIVATTSDRRKLTKLDRTLLDAQVNADEYADIDTDLQSQLSAMNVNNTPCPATLRSYEDVINKQIDHTPHVGSAYYSVDHQRIMQGRNILVLSEVELTRLETHIAALKTKKSDIIKRVLQSSLFNTDMVQKFKKFHKWKSKVEQYQKMHRHIVAAKLQSAVRRFINRVSCHIYYHSAVYCHSLVIVICRTHWTRSDQNSLHGASGSDGKYMISSA